ncbi:hypothetical protein DES52_103109 [Deinococcus yavapaiensis KR-236]|uniref:Uncharacterized protein n=1 Tax=Deinococcus yavapaiensis KR-236 TaxID=694435 RepID=A0A318SA66_9DEIO|nr:hypothetical protein DES52_103109 [Deinococcus yavapaiensis KR-236]
MGAVGAAETSGVVLGTVTSAADVDVDRSTFAERSTHDDKESRAVSKASRERFMEVPLVWRITKGRAA